MRGAGRPEKHRPQARRVCIDFRLGDRGAGGQGGGAPATRVQFIDLGQRSVRSRVWLCCPRCRRAGCGPHRGHCRRTLRVALADPPTSPPSTRWHWLTRREIRRSSSRVAAAGHAGQGLPPRRQIAGTGARSWLTSDGRLWSNPTSATCTTDQRHRRGARRAAAVTVFEERCACAPATCTSSRRNGRCASASASTACCTCRPIRRQDRGRGGAAPEARCRAWTSPRSGCRRIGRFNVKMKNGAVDVRISTMPRSMANRW